MTREVATLAGGCGGKTPRPTYDEVCGGHSAQYRSAIFFHSPGQEATARQMVAKLTRDKMFGGAIVTEIVPAGPFHVAEVRTTSTA